MQRLIDANKIEYEKTHIVEASYVLKDNIDSISTVLTIPDNPTVGDMINAIFSVVGFTPLTWHTSLDRKEGFHVHIEDCFKDDFQLTVSKDLWNAPWKRGGANT